MSLYETAASVRKIIVWGILGLLALLLLVVLFNFLRDLYRQINPPPVSPPTAGFGKLPALHLPALPIKGTPSYFLETATGELPTFPDRAEVVAMQEIKITPLGEQRAKELAKKFDFGGEGELSADKKAVIFKDVVDKRTLTVNLTSQNFTLTTDITHIQTTIPKGSALTGGEVIKEAQEFLNRNGLLKGGFGEGRQATQAHKVEGGGVKDAISVSEGQFTRVDFFRNLTGVSANSFSILPPKPQIGLIQVWITSGLKPEINNILYLSYTMWEINKEKVETYPLRPVAEAWEEVKKGRGVAEVLLQGTSPLDPYTPLTLKTVSIRKVELAYFDDPLWQKYLQPIYVFTGSAKTDNGKDTTFVTYTSAISTSWIQP